MLYTEVQEAIQMIANQLSDLMCDPKMQFAYLAAFGLANNCTLVAMLGILETV